MYIDPVPTTAGSSALTEEDHPKIVAAKNANIGAQALLGAGIEAEADIAVWEREFTPETQTAIDRYLHFLTNQPRSPLAKVEATGSALSLALEIAKALEAATPPHLQEESRLIARDIMGRLCDYAENSSSNGLAMRFEFRRDAMPEAMPGIVCTSYSLSALVSSQVAADKAAYFAENFASKQVRQFNPSWVGTTTANRDLGAYLALGDVPHILLVIGSNAANDMRSADNNADLDLIRAMGPDILSVQGAIAAAATAFTTDGNMAFGNDIAELMSKLAELQSIADDAGTAGALDAQGQHIETLLTNIATLEQTITSNLDTGTAATLMKGVHDTLQNIALQLGNTPLADMVMQLAVENPAQSRLENALAETEAVLAEMLESGNLDAEQKAEIQKLKDMISNHMAGEPLSGALIAQLETAGKLANGALGEKLTKSIQNLSATQSAVATLAAGLGIDVLRQSASMVTKLYEIQTAINSARTGGAPLSPSQVENIRAVEPHIAATLAQIQAAPASPAALSSLGKLETAISQVQGVLPANIVGKAEAIAAQTGQMSVALHVKTAELNNTSVQNIVRSVSTLQNLEVLQVQLAQNARSTPQQTAISNQVAQAIEALKAAPATAETLQKLNALATTVASIPPSANFLPPGAQAAMPGVIAGISAMGGKQGDGAPQTKKAEQAKKAEQTAKAEERKVERAAQETTASTVTPAITPTTTPVSLAPKEATRPSEQVSVQPIRAANDPTPLIFTAGAAPFVPASPTANTDIKHTETAPAVNHSIKNALEQQETTKTVSVNGPCKGGDNCACDPIKDFTNAASTQEGMKARDQLFENALNGQEIEHGNGCACHPREDFNKAANDTETSPTLETSRQQTAEIEKAAANADSAFKCAFNSSCKTPCSDGKGCASIYTEEKLTEINKRMEQENWNLGSADNDNRSKRSSPQKRMPS